MAVMVMMVTIMVMLVVVMVKGDDSDWDGGGSGYAGDVRGDGDDDDLCELLAGSARAHELQRLGLDDLVEFELHGALGQRAARRGQLLVDARLPLRKARLVVA
eukprot:8412332-Pyramimonas_sp.AAC.1